MTAPANQPQHVPAGSPNGGQFAPGGGVPSNKTGKGHGTKAPPVGPLTTSISYNAKTNTGTGYNQKHGDPHVHELQKALNRLGYTDGAGHSLKLDGKLGPLTTQAIKAVQQRIGMKPDGIVTPELYARIIASPARQPAPAHRGSSTLHPEATERLHEYWVHGEGAAKIAWGAPGDFDRCVVELGKYIGDPQGYCNLAHHAATGMWPAQHAAMEKGHRTVKEALVTVRADKTPYGDVEYADPGYQSDGKKRYPIDTHDHCVAAWDYINQADNASKYSSQHLAEVKGRIKGAGKKFGIEFSDESSDRAGAPRSLYMRNYTLDDVSVRSVADGREVTAYAAVFNTPTEIRDQDGHYNEELDPTVFNKALADRAPQGGRRSWRVGVFYNHMMHPLSATPNPSYGVPIGVPVDIKADGKGLLTVTRYHRSQLADEVVEGLESGAIPGYSFSGRFLRTNPTIPRRGFVPDLRSGRLPTARRMESTLHEYGPTPFPAYPDAAVTAIRSDSLLYALMNNGWSADELIKLLRDNTGQAVVASQHSDLEPLPVEPRPAHSARSLKEEMAAQRSRFLQKYGSR